MRSQSRPEYLWEIFPCPGPLWAVLARSWGLCGRFWTSLGPLWPVLLDLGAPRAAKSAPRAAKGGSRAAPRAARSAPRAGKSDPRATQERPRPAQERPRAAQERRKSGQERPKSDPRAAKTAQESFKMRSCVRSPFLQKSAYSGGGSAIWEVLGPMLAVLGRSWGLYWRSWAALGAYVGGLGNGSGPKLAVLGPKWSVLEAIRAKSGPNPSGKAIRKGAAPPKAFRSALPFFLIDIMYIVCVYTH